MNDYFTEKLIQQRTSFDCTVACIAMFAKTSYEEAFSLCQEYGWDPSQEKGVEEFIEEAVLEHLVMFPVIYGRWNFHYPAIMALPSLNFSGLLHSVYVENDIVYDPNYGRKDKAFYSPQCQIHSYAYTLQSLKHEGVRQAAFDEQEKLRESLERVTHYLNEQNKKLNK